MEPVHASHQHALVALSILISIVSAYVAIDLSERLRQARGRTWLAWLSGAAIVDAIGTWSMHYTGKLALRLPVPLRFDWRIVLLSLAVGIAGSAAALLIAGRNEIGWPRAIAAGTALGAIGISGLHYVAMHAMQLGHRYSSSTLVLFSIALSIAISSLAIAFTFRFPFESAWQRHGSAWLRGMANPAMHYTAMAAAVFYATGAAPHLSHSVSIAALGVVGISVVPVMVLVVALLTAVVDRLHTQKALLDELFEQSPQAVALMDAQGRVIRVNRELTRMFGLAAEEVKGSVLDELSATEDEGVRRRADGSRFSVEMVRVPVSMPGGQIERYAIFTDVTERRKAEEALRLYPRRLIEMQEAERGRLARELHDEVGQVLTGAAMILAAHDELPRVAEARKLLNELIDRVRSLALDLRPALLDDFGLDAALAWLFERFSAQTSIRVDAQVTGLDERRFDAEIETAAYRIVQEALTNIARHAGVDEAVVRMRADGALRIVIEDRGIGFDLRSANASGHLGLASMRERAKIVNGKLTIETAPGAGTRISAELPLSIRADG